MARTTVLLTVSAALLLAAAFLLMGIDFGSAKEVVRRMRFRSLPV